jgi:hypothetical protein
VFDLIDDCNSHLYLEVSVWLKHFLLVLTDEVFDEVESLFSHFVGVILICLLWALHKTILYLPHL